MKNRIVRLCGAAALAAGLMFAQSTGTGEATAAPNQEGHGQRMVQHAAKVLNLSTEQQTQLTQIIAGFHQAAQPVHQQLRTDEAALMSAAKANPQADLSAQAAAVAKDLTQLAVSRAQAFGQFYSILNQTQKQQVDSAAGHLPLFGGFGRGR